MTRVTKKKRERHFVDQAARALGAQWIIEAEREHPDFLVIEGECRFGLEICEIFTGPQDHSGSAMKRKESLVQKQIDVLRRQYEARSATKLRVLIVGQLNLENMGAVLSALIDEEMPSKKVGHHVIVDQIDGLRLYVTKAFLSEWLSVDHRAGWVDRNPIGTIINAVERKSEDLPRYVSAAGPDIRLLLVADRYHNSGKLMLNDTPSILTRGFRKVYFYSYPETITTFEAS